MGLPGVLDMGPGLGQPTTSKLAVTIKGLISMGCLGPLPRP